MIAWPAVVKHDGEDELIYIVSEQDWLNDEEMLLYVFSDRDVLIDSHGHVFSLPAVQQNMASTEVLGTATLENMIELAQLHAAVNQQCCVGKIGAGNIAEVMQIIASMQDN
ncbi:DUF4144 family protein [Thalassotalea maritima]|uniref:DUF4144 family protein n=1 Tax=Thalassotalea maritima TaxID=3242416 RepID=UPI003526F4E0